MMYGKVKLSLCIINWALPWRYIREWSYSATILDLCSIIEVRRQLQALTTLPLGKQPISREAGWVPGLVWTTEKRKISCPCWESNPNHTSHSPSLWQQTSFRIVILQAGTWTWVLLELQHLYMAVYISRPQFYTSLVNPNYVIFVVLHQC
jgi:hypothetical protein